MKSSVNFFPNQNISHTKLDGYTSAANIVSDPILLAYADQFAITAFWTGSGTGSFKLQGSTDKERVLDQAVVNGVADPKIVNWVDIPNSTQASSVGSPLMWNYSEVGYRWVRIVYTVASSSITLSVTVQLKGGL